MRRFLAQKMTPYTKAGAQKIQRNEQQAKGAKNYLCGQDSTQTNIPHLVNVL